MLGRDLPTPGCSKGAQFCILSSQGGREMEEGGTELSTDIFFAFATKKYVTQKSIESAQLQVEIW